MNALIPELRKKKASRSIVLLLHEGGQQTGPFSAGFANINGCEGLAGPVIDIVNRLDDEVDVVASAHTHRRTCARSTGSSVTSASSFGRLITDIELTVTRPHGDVIAKSAVNRIVTRDVAKDPEITALMRALRGLRRADRKRDRGIDHRRHHAHAERGGRVGARRRDRRRAARGDAGAADHGGAVIALMNPGGIRADLVYSQISGGEAPGEVTFGEAVQRAAVRQRVGRQTCTGDADRGDPRAAVRLARPGSADPPGVRWLHVLVVAERGRPGSKVDPASIKLDGVTLGAGDALPGDDEQLPRRRAVTGSRASTTAPTISAASWTWTRWRRYFRDALACCRQGRRTGSRRFRRRPTSVRHEGPVCPGPRPSGCAACLIS